MSDYEFDENASEVSDVESVEEDAEEQKTYLALIYKIVYKDDPTQFYIGSTINTLKRRLALHRVASKRGTSKFYTFMREKGTDKFKIELIQDIQVADGPEMRRTEQAFIDLLDPTLNEIRAFQTEEQYRQQAKELGQRTYQRNRNKLRCETCNFGFDTPSKLNRHNSSRGHRKKTGQL